MKKSQSQQYSRMPPIQWERLTSVLLFALGMITGAVLLGALLLMMVYLPHLFLK
jgi:hypothetical protein